MAKKTSTSLPLTFDLPLDLIAKIEVRRRALALRSTSEVVREALASFNFNRFSTEHMGHRQISVRLPEGQKAELSRHARKKSTSTGELVRAALVQLLARPAKKSGGRHKRPKD
jgi:Arc/MetJ-type ribon-helix-helix transcriptional regulator